MVGLSALATVRGPVSLVIVFVPYMNVQVARKAVRTRTTPSTCLHGCITTLKSHGLTGRSTDKSIAGLLTVQV